MDWEEFYNFIRQHGAFEGKTPYEKQDYVKIYLNGHQK